MKKVENQLEKNKLDYKLMFILFIIIYLFYTNRQIKTNQNNINIAIGLAEEARSAAEEASDYAAEAAENAADAAYYSRYRN